VNKKLFGCRNKKVLEEEGERDRVSMRKRKELVNNKKFGCRKKEGSRGRG
jgi:hypothetical protein